METLYIVTALTKDKKGELHSSSYKQKKEALDAYQVMCENYLNYHYRVTKRQIVEETIVESDDYRQQKFSF